ncbi:MAG: glycoside hydrolase family 16 protein [Planctomyces sp.]|nr:glycoside hydrolase family 16 protein [Planctomyces sp.]
MPRPGPSFPLRLLLSVVLIAAALFASTASIAALFGDDETGGAEVLFFDDFSGDRLDRTRWNAEVSGDVHNNERQCYIDSEETARLVSSDEAPGSTGGALVIQPHHRPGTRSTRGRSYDFVSARLNTRDRFEFTHGTAAARIRMPDAVGVWPAFWMLGNGRWPETGEVDIMEYVGEKDWIGVALHGPGYSGETPLVNKFYFPPGEDASDWHVYSVEWTAEQFLFKVDDRLAYRATRPMVEHYGRWAFDEPKFLILNFALGGAYPFKTNGIREPHNGLPESTVQAIRDGQLRMEVDWVRVTRP